MDINAEIKNLSKKLESEKKSALEKIEKEYGKKLKKLKKSCVLCRKDDFFEYLDRYDEKSNTIVKSVDKRGIPKKHTGCGMYSLKSDVIVVSVEDYENNQLSSDAGYGDYDEYAFQRVKRYYWVCPICKTMNYLKMEVLSTGPSYYRKGSDEEFNNARAFVPLNFIPIVKVESRKLTRKFIERSRFR